MSKLENEASIPALLSEMTVQEKVDLLVGASTFRTCALPQYGIPSLLYLDGATGVNLMQYAMEFAAGLKAQEEAKSGEGVVSADENPSSSAGNADSRHEDSASTNESGASALHLMTYLTGQEEIPEGLPKPLFDTLCALREKILAVRPNGEEPGCFPPGMLLGATFHPERVTDVADAVARETMAYGVDVLLGTPNTNIQRDPKCGRVFESFSEDPYLSSQMAPAFVKAVQETGMVADVKHFAANNQETLRQGINERISERAMREIYLPGFEAAVKEGGALTVMSAYNSINGLPCAQNPWLLTDVLKKEWGFDGQVVSDWGAVYDQVKALVAGNDLDMPGPRGKAAILRALESGELSMERLDDAVRRMLKVVLASPAFRGRTYTEIDNDRSKQAAYRAAAEGITLLKNNGVLPLERGAGLSFYGPLCKRLIDSGVGSAQVDTSKTTSLLEETKRYTDTALFEEMQDDTETVIFVAGATGQEGSDRPDMDFNEADKRMLQEQIPLAKKAGKQVVLLLNVAGPVELGEFMDQVDALVCLFFPGMEGGRAAADILFGEVSPSGKLPITFPKTYRQCPAAINFPGEYGTVNYGEGIFVGYRYYDYKGLDPLFPFGFGLSYSTFRLEKAELSDGEYAYEGDAPLVVRVTIKNTGRVPAAEVVQVYVHEENPELLRPEQELKGFRKVFLEPGESAEIEIPLNLRSFAAYDTDLRTWTVKPGMFEVRVGTSSRDIAFRLPVAVTGKNPYGWSARTVIRKVANSEDALKLVKEVFGPVFSESQIKGDAEYFGNTRLVDFLTRTCRKQEEESLWQEKMDRLNDKLSALEADW